MAKKKTATARRRARPRNAPEERSPAKSAFILRPPFANDRPSPDSVGWALEYQIAPTIRAVNALVSLEGGIHLPIILMLGDLSRFADGLASLLKSGEFPEFEYDGHHHVTDLARAIQAVSRCRTSNYPQRIDVNEVIATLSMHLCTASAVAEDAAASPDGGAA